MHLVRTLDFSEDVVVVRYLIHPSGCWLLVVGCWLLLLSHSQCTINFSKSKNFFLF